MLNVILTPHVAGWTFESHERLAQVIVDKIKANYLGKPGLDIAEKRVSGIGGFFFKAENSKELVVRQASRFKTDLWVHFWWKDENGKDCSTQWSPLLLILLILRQAKNSLCKIFA
jgi:D-3-phosphoglycerate dehydrogenase